MNNGTLGDGWIEALLLPETNLEHSILKNPAFRMGLLWGKPRFGHPEGQVVYHIREVLDNIEKIDLSRKERAQLRLITLAHDTFKYLEDKGGHPRDWTKHHAVYARKFMESFTDDPLVLDITELHDEAYYSWRLVHLYAEPQLGQDRLNRLLERVDDYLQMYYIFFKCDTRTGDKNPAPLKWFEQTVEDIDRISF